MSREWYNSGQLPPIGGMCEFKHHTGKWIESTVVAHTIDDEYTYAIVQFGAGWSYSSDFRNFRALKFDDSILAKAARWFRAQ
jgi:hypothetical protein